MAALLGMQMQMSGVGAPRQAGAASLRRSAGVTPRRSPAFTVRAATPATYDRDLSSAPRFIQHKNEAKVFYAFLAQVYDYIVNPGHWTVDMRTEALEPAQLGDPTLKVRLRSRPLTAAAAAGRCL